MEFNIPSVEKTVKILRKNVAISELDKKVFIWALVVGIVSYFPSITLWLCNPDTFWNGMFCSKGSRWEMVCGRYGLAFFNWIKEYITSPSVATITSVILLSLICVLVCRMLEFRGGVAMGSGGLAYGTYTLCYKHPFLLLLLN